MNMQTKHKVLNFLKKTSGIFDKQNSVLRLLKYIVRISNIFVFQNIFWSHIVIDIQSSNNKHIKTRFCYSPSKIKIFIYKFKSFIKFNLLKYFGRTKNTI